MNNKPAPTFSKAPTTLDLAAAVEAFVAQGGVIAIIPDGESADVPPAASTEEQCAADTEFDAQTKLELLKALAAKGAGVSSLQYSLKMNKKEIRQLAQEHGVKINFSRPIRALRKTIHHEASDIDDVVAGHAMHYSSLGYSVPEIAQLLGLSVRQIWDLGKVYRFEFQQKT